MKIAILTLLFVSFGTIANAQSGILKSVGGLAKDKAKTNASDFNSSRSNREKGNIGDEKDKSTTLNSDSTSNETISVSVPTSYTFKLHLAYEMQDLSKKKSEVNTMNQYFAEDAYMIRLDEANNSIFDWKNELMIMIDEKNKSAMAMSTKMMQNHIEKEVTEESSNYTFTRTGNKKEILGYMCEEVISTNTEKGTKVVSWYTNDVTNEFAAKYGKQLMANSKQESKPPKDMENSMMMEFTAFDKKGEAESHMFITVYERIESTKDLSTYRITKL